MNKFFTDMVNKILVNNNDSNYTHSIFDISEYTGNSYSTLSDALDDVPIQKCKGGMTVRYVLIDDNNYVQFRFMLSGSFTSAQFTNPANWQGVDDVPTAGSKNLVESGGVKDELNKKGTYDLFIINDTIPVELKNTLLGIACNFDYNTIKLNSFVNSENGKEINISALIGEQTIVFYYHKTEGYSTLKEVRKIELDNGLYILLYLNWGTSIINITSVDYEFNPTRIIRIYSHIEEEVEELSNIFDATINGGNITHTTTQFPDTGKFLYQDTTIDDSNYNITDYINIKGATRIIINSVYTTQYGCLGYVIYDENKNAISQSPIPPATDGLQNYDLSGVDIPVGSAYLRCTQHIIQISSSSIVITKLVEGLSNNVDELEDSIANLEEEIEAIEDTSEKIEGLIVSEVPKNIIDSVISTVGVHLKTTDGTTKSNINFTVSDFVKIKPSTTYHVGKRVANYGGYADYNFAELCYYDDNKVFISGATSQRTFTTPNNAKFIRFSVLSKEYSETSGVDNIAADCQLVEGTSVVQLTRYDIFNKVFPFTGLYGKKWLLIGDSNTHHNHRAAVKYDEFIENYTGVVPNNIGVSGAGYRVYQNTNYVFLNILNNFVQSNPDYVPDFITIAGGTNDVCFDTANIGVYTDTTSDTVFGMMYLLIQRIKEVYPNVPFAILTQFPQYYTGEYVSKNEYLQPFVEEQIKFCRYRNIPVLDLYFCSGLRPEEADFNKHFYSCEASPNGDGIHLNYFGQMLISSRIREFLLERFGEIDR